MSNILWVSKNYYGGNESSNFGNAFRKEKTGYEVNSHIFFATSNKHALVFAHGLTLVNASIYSHFGMHIKLM